MTSDGAPVFMFPSDDPAIGEASQMARENFRYFWREVAWERRRIIPGLDIASVKVAFRDEDDPNEDDPTVEHMWLADVDFDGKSVSGDLLNEPNWLKSVKQGDRAEVPLNRLGDWMYAISGRVYGAYTVNLLRSRMARPERRAHDKAWGLDFGDPEQIEVVPPPQADLKKGGFLAGLFGGNKPPPPSIVDQDAEHPMSENMGPALREQLEKDPSLMETKDERGWTLLHHQALAGSKASAEILLEMGADRNAVTGHGMTPIQLAEVLGWERIIALLSS